MGGNIIKKLLLYLFGMYIARWKSVFLNAIFRLYIDAPNFCVNKKKLSLTNRKREQRSECP